MAFIPYSNDRKGEVALTVDKMGRICLSAGLRRKLDSVGREVELVLYFDPDTRKIGISKEGQGRIKPFRFDKDRGYTDAKRFLTDNDILYKDGAVRYYYQTTVGGVMAFSATRSYSRDSDQRFRQEKNGNLERVASSK